MFRWYSKECRKWLISSKDGIYDQDDAGFVFTKGPSRAKRAAAKAAAISSSNTDVALTTEPTIRHEPQPSMLLSAITPRYTSTSRRSSQRSSPKLEQPETIPTINKVIARQTTSDESIKQSSTNRKSINHVIATPRASMVRRSPRLRHDDSLQEQGIKIPLSGAEDTPLVVKKRSKPIIKPTTTGHRRSSMGLRGRRSSSLTGGFIGEQSCITWRYFTTNSSPAAPHPEVQPVDFYKHIDAGLMEVPRMHQLLTWCGRRALDDQRVKSSKDRHGNARAAGRI